MLLLTVRTDKPEAEIGLYQDEKQLHYEVWEGHRLLAETILTKIEAILQTASKSLKDIEGIVFFSGPGSFTGLRIGVAVVNTLAHSLQIPIIGKTTSAWLEDGIQAVLVGENDTTVLPFYGGEIHISEPKK